MFKYLSLIFFTIILTGCSTISNMKSYNTPFINSEEMIQLQLGMKKSLVLEKLGYPLYVKSGINGTIIWVYEVRSTEVLSDTDLLTKEIKYNKSNANNRHSSPLHQIEIMFIDNQVKQWKIVNEEIKSKSILPDLPLKSGTVLTKIKDLIPFK